jgi:fructose-specific component phosphotransferase system IIB-like protein
MKTIKILSLVSFLSLGLAGAASAAETRGQVQVPAAAAKAVVVGPTAIHAYSAFSGAKLFIVGAVTGTDRDCQAGAAKGATALPADRVELLTVGSGQMVCVASTGERSIELLWKAQKGAPTSTLLATIR